MTGNTDVQPWLYDKSYTIKSSYHSHLKQKHKAIETVEGLENGSDVSRKKNAESLSTWIENENEYPGMWVSYLCSYLENRNDHSLAAASIESEKAIELNQAESLGWTCQQSEGASVKTCPNARARGQGRGPRGRLLLNHPSFARRLLSLVTQRECGDITLPDESSDQSY